MKVSTISSTDKGEEIMGKRVMSIIGFTGYPIAPFIGVVIKSHGDSVLVSKDGSSDLDKLDEFWVSDLQII